MRKSSIWVGWLAAAALVAPLFAASMAWADCEGMRAFRGEIQKFKKTGRRAGFVLDNRMGDKVKFEKAEGVTVTDTRAVEKKAQKWEDLKNGLYVEACWKFTDKPRLAYAVTVEEPPAEDAVEE